MEGAVHSHRDFRVRKSVVHRALNWLVTHNQYYRSNHVHIDVNALEQLPHDGNLSQLTSITVESASTEPPATNTPATGPPVADTLVWFPDPSVMGMRGRERRVWEITILPHGPWNLTCTYL